MLTGQDLINNMGSYQAVSDCIKKSSMDDIVSAVCQIINIDDSNMLFTMTADQRLRNGTVCTYIDLKNHIDFI